MRVLRVNRIHELQENYVEDSYMPIVLKEEFTSVQAEFVCSRSRMCGYSKISGFFL